MSRFDIQRGCGLRSFLTAAPLPHSFAWVIAATIGLSLTSCAQAQDQHLAERLLARSTLKDCAVTINEVGPPTVMTGMLKGANELQGPRFYEGRRGKLSSDEYINGGWFIGFDDKIARDVERRQAATTPRDPDGFTPTSWGVARLRARRVDGKIQCGPHEEGRTAILVEALENYRPLD